MMLEMNGNKETSNLSLLPHGLEIKKQRESIDTAHISLVGTS